MYPLPFCSTINTSIHSFQPWTHENLTCDMFVPCVLCDECAICVPYMPCVLSVCHTWHVCCVMCVLSICHFGATCAMHAVCVVCHVCCCCCCSPLSVSLLNLAFPLQSVHVLKHSASAAHVPLSPAEVTNVFISHRKHHLYSWLVQPSSSG